MQRIGTGFDLHWLVAGRPLILGGVKIKYHLGLEGHSDADVLTHALMDALLGAAGLGDIGEHFPPTSSRYLNISSLKLLAEVKKMLDALSFKLINCDLTVICEAPKITPYKGQIRQALSLVLDTPENCINVKATTTEGLFFVHPAEAICAQAAVLLKK